MAQDHDDCHSVASVESENSYLARRAAKIARNQARLRELGLISDSSHASDAGSNKAAVQSLQQQPRKRRKEPTVSPQPIRRSTRASRGKTAPLLLDEQATWTAETTRSDQRKHAIIKEQILQTNIILARATKTTPIITYPTSSARQMSIDITKLLYGGKGLLGRLLASTGKATVMDTSASLAADPSQFSGAHVSFNKYSGVQEWANCFFLWVNFGAPNNQVVNEFYQSGRQVIWFGGSSMHDQTPVVQKLKQSCNRGRVILWCREYLIEPRTFGPYTCFGRLELVTYDGSKQPVEFVWNLLDYDHIVSSSANDSTAVEMMRRYAGSGVFL
jgi:hypothetical protein